MEEASQEEIVHKLAELTRYEREYHAQWHRARWGPDEKARFEAYHATQVLAQQYFEASAWFIKRGISLMFDEANKEYAALIDPPVYPA